MHPNKEEDVVEECKELVTGTSKNLSDQKRQGGKHHEIEIEFTTKIEFWIDNALDKSSN